MKSIFTYLMVFLFTSIGFQAFSQTIISGSVNDGKTNQPLTNATIKIKGTKAIALTNKAGEFTLSYTGSADSLSVFYQGYLAQTVVLRGQTVFNFKLNEDVQHLSDVVITGVAEGCTAAYSASQYLGRDKK